MPRSPLTEKFLRIVALRDEVKTWPQDEQDFFLDMLAPEPVKLQGRTGKRGSKKVSSKSSTKTARASGMAAAIKGNIEAGRQAVKESNDDDDERCIRELENKDGSLTVCGLLADDNIHHLRTHSHYHEFTTGKSVAPPVSGRSSANGGAGATTASSGTETEDVSNAVHAGG